MSDRIHINVMDFVGKVLAGVVEKGDSIRILFDDGSFLTMNPSRDEEVHVEGYSRTEEQNSNA